MKNAIIETIEKLPTGILLKDGELLTKERAEKAIRKALGKRRVSRAINANPVRIPLMLSRDRSKIGVVLNRNAGLCRMEGCTGHRQYVVWEDGTRTYPCTKGCSGVADYIEQIGVNPDPVVVLPEKTNQEQDKPGQTKPEKSEDDMNAEDYKALYPGAKTRSCSSLQEHDQVVFLCRDYSNDKLFPLDGSVMAVYEDRQKVLISYLLGYKGENEDVPFDRMIAVYDPKGQHMKFNNISGPSCLLTVE